LPLQGRKESASRVKLIPTCEATRIVAIELRPKPARQSPTLPIPIFLGPTQNLPAAVASRQARKLLKV
jgi:hypothetical protein